MAEVRGALGKVAVGFSIAPPVTFLILNCINACEHLWSSVCQAVRFKVQRTAWKFDETGRYPSHVKQALLVRMAFTFEVVFAERRAR